VCGFLYTNTDTNTNTNTNNNTNTNTNYNKFNFEVQRVDNQIANIENIITSNFNHLSQYFNNNDNKAGELGENFIYDFFISIFITQ